MYQGCVEETIVEETYEETINYIRKRLSFTILKTAIIALRGKRKTGRSRTTPISEVDMNLAYFNL